MSIEHIQDMSELFETFEKFHEDMAFLENIDDAAAFPSRFNKFLKAWRRKTPWWHPRTIFKRAWEFYMLALLFIAIAGGFLPVLLLPSLLALSLFSLGESIEKGFVLIKKETRKALDFFVLEKKEEKNSQELKDTYVYIKETSTLHYNKQSLVIPKELVEEQIKAWIEAFERKLYWVRVFLKKLAILASIVLATLFFVAGLTWFIGEGGLAFFLSGTALASLTPALPFLILMGSILIFTATALSVGILVVSTVYKWRNEIKEYFKGEDFFIEPLISVVKEVASFVVSTIERVVSAVTSVFSFFFAKKETISPVPKETSSQYPLFFLRYDITPPVKIEPKPQKMVGKKEFNQTSNFFAFFSYSTPVPKKCKLEVQETPDFFLKNAGY